MKSTRIHVFFSVDPRLLKKGEESLSGDSVNLSFFKNTMQTTSINLHDVVGRSSKIELNAHHEKTLTPVLQAAKGQLVKAYVQANAGTLSPSDVGANAFPTGQVLAFKGTAKLDPACLRPDSFKVVSFSKIIPGPGERLTDDKFQTAQSLDKLNKCVSESVEDPLTLDLRSANNIDNDVWTPELGGDGCVGIYKKARNARTNDYYIGVMCSAQKLGQGVIEHVKSKPDMTWGEFADSQQLKFWREGVRRNARLIALSAAEKLGVAIETFSDDSFHLKNVKVAQPTAECAISSIRLGRNMSDATFGQSDVIIMSQCSPVTNKAGSLEVQPHIVAVSPYTGFVSVQINNGRPVSGALPTTTGRAVPHSKVNIKTIPAEDAHHIASYYTWDGKKPEDKNVLNPLAHPNAYRAFDSAFVEAAFADQGIKTSQIDQEKYLVVIAKIPAPKAV